MRTELTDREHLILHNVIREFPLQTFRSYINSDPDLASLIERSLVSVEFGKDGGTFLCPTENGAFLARIYGEP